MKNHLSASLEDYLETIYQLRQENIPARTSQIAACLNVKLSTVTWALKQLSQEELVNYKPYQVVTLTETGLKLAMEINQKHQLLKLFFQEMLFLEEEEAEQNACQIEHVLTEKGWQRFMVFLQFIENCPRSNEIFFNHFKSYLENPVESYQTCKSCLENCLVSWEKKENEEITLRLDQLKKGESGTIHAISLDAEVSELYKGLGLETGAKLKIIEISPDSKTRLIQINQTHLTLRPAETEQIKVSKKRNQ